MYEYYDYKFIKFNLVCYTLLNFNSISDNKKKIYITRMIFLDIPHNT